ncbi:hypothetical protein G5V59_02605 [Nocardioides sp. W3-2-3]|uniref:hypothetical protein n=1 Tax=Nocardioides convexus TaxID=2712224 RepID=UPI0024187D5C|nr:hypothetical protein [Nocardioides convexus]NGZ99643.1 hypothetical protein [Nocardioides convexus]
MPPPHPGTPQPPGLDAPPRGRAGLAPHPRVVPRARRRPHRRAPRGRRTAGDPHRRRTEAVRGLHQGVEGHPGWTRRPAARPIVGVPGLPEGVLRGGIRHRGPRLPGQRHRRFRLVHPAGSRRRGRRHHRPAGLSGDDPGVDRPRRRHRDLLLVEGRCASLASRLVFWPDVLQRATEVRSRPSRSATA